MKYVILKIIKTQNSSLPNGFFLRFYLFIFRQKGKDGEREGEKYQRVVTSHAPPNWGPGSQSRHVPWLGIEPATLWFAGGCASHWATPARALSNDFIHFTVVTFALEVIAAQSIFLVGIVSVRLPQTSSQLHIHWHHIGSSKSATEGIFMSRKSANPTKQGLPVSLPTPNMASS